MNKRIIWVKTSQRVVHAFDASGTGLTMKSLCGSDFAPPKTTRTRTESDQHQHKDGRCKFCWSLLKTTERTR